ncbi:MAG: hypothetical protein JW807_06765 [Spirochaetes bacterium]|nr:hypothetical protein [Spirochaetota bacterium]
MKDLKPQIVRSFRMEMIGTGCYGELAKQYGKRLPELSEKFRNFSEHERTHGKLLAKCHSDLYGSDIQGEHFWLFIGKVSAFLQYFLPLKVKLKILSGVEMLAVQEIERALADGTESSFHKVISDILPDEKEHAGFYDEWCAVR